MQPEILSARFQMQETVTLGEALFLIDQVRRAEPFTRWFGGRLTSKSFSGSCFGVPFRDVVILSYSIPEG